MTQTNKEFANGSRPFITIATAGTAVAFEPFIRKIYYTIRQRNKEKAVPWGRLVGCARELEHSCDSIDY